MFRKLKFFSGKHPRVLPLTVAFVALISLSVLTYGLDFAAIKDDGKVDTVMRPSVESAKITAPERIADGSAPEGTVPEDSGQEIARSGGCENLLLSVGPDHVLTPDYVPSDLVYLSAYGIPARGAEDMLRQEAAVQLGRLVSAAAADGVEVLAASGYRSYWEQKGTFAWFKNAYGEDAGKLSVPPGQSEHQLGTAVDFSSSEAGYELVSTFAQTSAGIWLTKHAIQYGFILSYKEGQEVETGVNYEPWHYRFVGTDNAREIGAAEKGPMSFYLEGMSYCYRP
ncbi:hypothetical protein BH24ACT20_BH24ACT20_03170 [soil metagenome]